ncbi:lysylphosphatidylglycerol synthetase, partial [Brucella oryzae]
CAFTLWGFRDSFYRRPISVPFVLSWNWSATVGSTVLVSTWLGYFVYRHLEDSNDLCWDFAWNSNAPRVLRATVLVFAVGAAVGLYSILN